MRAIWVTVLLSFLSSALVFSQSASPGGQSARLDRLFHAYIAPCCWSKSLAEHNSQEAYNVRAEIETMVRTGRSDDEIQALLVGKYGKRIMAIPDGEPRVWLFAMPSAALLLGMAGGWWFLTRLRQRPQMAGAAAELEPGWDRDE